MSGDLGGASLAVIAAYEELEVVAQGARLVGVGGPEAHGGHASLADRAGAAWDGERDEEDAGQLLAHVARLPGLPRDGDRIDLADGGRFERLEGLAHRDRLQPDAQRMQVGAPRAAATSTSRAAAGASSPTWRAPSRPPAAPTKRTRPRLWRRASAGLQRCAPPPTRTSTSWRSWPWRRPAMAASRTS